MVCILTSACKEKDMSMKMNNPRNVRGVVSYKRSFNDLNDTHMAVAKKIGVKPIKNREAAKNMGSRLVEIEAGDLYQIDSLTHSIPFLIPKASALLDSVGANFLDSLESKGLNPNQVIVTSVLRTQDDVKKLRRVNLNASANSVHMFGTTFVISYKRFSKVEDPDELDTRFSKFSPSYDDADDYNDFTDEYDDLADDSADEIIGYYADDSQPDPEDSLRDSFVSLRDLLANKLSGKNSTKSEHASTDASNEAEHDLFRIYRFHDFATLERLSSVLKNVYFGSNTLYKDNVNSIYYLVVNKSGHSPEEFNRICNILTEYGVRENTTSSREAFFMEHFTPMIKEDALQILSTL